MFFFSSVYIRWISPDLREEVIAATPPPHPGAREFIVMGAIEGEKRIAQEGKTGKMAKNETNKEKTYKVQ